jgi:omega-6 fatty acid desaturase (delta-12 desaturase)
LKRKRHSHNLHHAKSGNLDRPQIGGLDTLTVREFQALPRRQQWRYRLYRHPLVLFGFGPMYTFLLVQIPITLLATTIGVWLFYVQHQFEGSSYYVLPGILRRVRNQVRMGAVTQ